MYMIQGASVANSPFFETEADCKLFLRLADRFLSRYLKINSFQNNRDGWAMIITTRSISDITGAYLERRAKSDKCKKEFEFTEVWRMLSDQIRIFLSTFVKATNHQTRRVGAKVRCRYKRFVFESAEEAKAKAESLAKEYYDQAQPRKRYRPSKKLCKLRKRMLRTSLYMSCALLDSVDKVRELGLGCLDLGVFVNDIARQIVSRTLNHHFPT